MRKINVLILLAWLLIGCRGEDMSVNSYNSITETLQARVLAPVLLSSYVTPPGAFNIAQADFVSFSFRRDIGTGPLYFSIMDIPRIKLTGMFCAIGDGLAPQPDRVEWLIQIIAVDNTGSNVGVIQSFNISETSFNEYTDCDFYQPTLDQIQTVLPGYIISGATSIKIEASVISNWDIAAYSMAAAWGGSFISILPKILVEHTFPMSSTP